MPTQPLVSVVIPTHERHQLVGRAVQSALNQTLAAIQVIVVIDGPDEATQRVLELIPDDRLRVVTLETNQGAGIARNVGVEHARAEWVAFLDDDDEWMPEKLEIQLRAAEQSTYRYPIIACRLIMHRGNTDVIVPRRVIGTNEPVSEYLFCRSGLFWGEGLLQTSTLLTKAELVRRLPFSAMRRGDDIDWVLRASLRQDVKVSFVAHRAPLAIWNISDYSNQPRPATPWRYSERMRWLEQNAFLFTPRAYASYLLLFRSQLAAHTRDPRIFFDLLVQAFRHGKPRWLDVLIYCGIWLGLHQWSRKMATYFRK